MLGSAESVISQHRLADCLVGSVILEKSCEFVLQIEIQALGVSDRF